MACEDGQDSESALRVKRRAKSLTPCLRLRLPCVFIRLPGPHYTVEIDPDNDKIVRWEWQHTAD